MLVHVDHLTLLTRLPLFCLQGLVVYDGSSADEAASVSKPAAGSDPPQAASPPALPGTSIPMLCFSYIMNI